MMIRPNIDRNIRRHNAQYKGREKGLTLAELVVSAAILAILASAALPIARIQLKREHERGLRRALRDVRTAIDRYKDAADQGMIEVELGAEGYPPDLESLVEGVDLLNSPDEKKLRLLRRIPLDPMTKSTDWGLRSYQDDTDSTNWGGENVFDIYTKYDGTALDGSNYSGW